RGTLGLRQPAGDPAAPRPSPSRTRGDGAVSRGAFTVAERRLMNHVSLSRRRLLAGAAGAVGIAVLQRVALAQIEVPPDPTKVPGRALTALGQRSPFERPRRLVSGVNQGTSLTPLQDLCGIVTPSDLHYERHHAGVPAIDPHRYKLLVHGMVERPTVFDLAALRRFPAVSRL